MFKVCSGFLKTPRSNVFFRGFSTFLTDLLSTEPVLWQKTTNPVFPYKTNLKGQALKLRVNDFPEEPLFTVVKETEAGVEDIMHTNGFKNNWLKVDADNNFNVGIKKP